MLARTCLGAQEGELFLWTVSVDNDIKYLDTIAKNPEDVLQA